LVEKHQPVAPEGGPERRLDPVDVRDGRLTGTTGEEEHRPPRCFTAFHRVRELELAGRHAAPVERDRERRARERRLRGAGPTRLNALRPARAEQRRESDQRKRKRTAHGRAW